LLVSRPSSIGLAAHVGLHIHLRPIDLDEARELVESVGVSVPPDSLALEELQRDSRGNPAVLLRLVERSFQWPRDTQAADPRFRQHLRVRGIEQSGATRTTYQSHLDAEARPDLAQEVVKQETGSTPSTARGPGRAEIPALVPSKPPIRDEEGLVEVGWDGDLEDELSSMNTAPSGPASFLSPEREAWLKRTDPATDTREAPADYQVQHSGKVMPAASGQPSSSASAPAGIRAEGQHEFAPYSQLFTRFRQSK
jgi:hypothetical protein